MRRTTSPLIIFSLVVAPLLGLYAQERSRPAAAKARQGDSFEYLVCPVGHENPRNSEASLLQLKDGRLLLAWSEFYTNDRSDWGPARISAMFSSDGGRSWQGKYTLQENIGKMNVLGPELLRLKSGKILFLVGQTNSLADIKVIWRISTDEARTWSKPKPIPVVPSPAYWINVHERVIQLASGRILEPLCYVDEHTKDIRPYYHIRPYYSDDEGRTWKPSRTIVGVPESKVGGQEPAVVELKDGSVLMLIRNSTGRIYKCYSRDQGESWSAPEPMDLVAPVSPAAIKRIPSTGDLLIVWNNSPNKRFPLTTAVSSDEGKTWRHVKNLDEDPEYTYSYPTITFVDRRVLFTYYAGKEAKPPSPVKFTWALKLKSVPVTWLYE